MIHAFLTLPLALALAPQDPASQGVAIDHVGGVLPQRARAEAVNAMLRERLETVLPRLMRETGIDLWLVINREYNEDPVYLTLVPEPVFAARRTTMLMFHDRGEEQGVERLTVSRYALQDVYQSAWEGGSWDDQWNRLASLIAERDPRRIGINRSEHWAFGDGLSSGLHAKLLECLGPLADRVVSAEDFCVRWLETRTRRELEVQSHCVALARAVIAEGFSSRVITPGVTTTDDVAWFLRQRFSDLQLPVWFMPYVNIQRRGSGEAADAPFLGRSGGVIRRGDVLHTDVGIDYLRLCTDTQEMGYVCRLGEHDVPPELVRALAVGNRFQDLLTFEFQTGRTGNEILAAARARMESEGMVPSIYSHPLGCFGHAAGPTIGMWDNQGPTPVRGDWKLFPSTCYAIEGNVKVALPEWDGQVVQIKLEQDAVFTGTDVLYLAGRQTEWHVVR